MREQEDELLKLLRSYPGADISEGQWKAIENRVMEAIREPAPRVIKLPRRFPPLIWLRPAPLFSFMLLFCLGICLYHFLQYRAALVKNAAMEWRKIQGNAFVQLDKSGWVSLNPTGPVFFSPQGKLKAGACLRTESGSKIGFSFNAKASFLLDQESELLVLSSSQASLRFLLVKGAVTAFVKPQSGIREVAVETENAICRVTGTVFKVMVKEKAGYDPKTTLWVERGKVRFISKKDTEQECLVAMGGQATLSGRALFGGALSADTQFNLEAGIEGLCASRPLDSLGYLHILTIPPGWSVFAEKMFVGITPLYTVHSVGQCGLSILGQGCLPYSETVNIKTGHSVRRSITMERAVVSAPAPAPLDVVLPSQPVYQAHTAMVHDSSLGDTLQDSLAMLNAKARRLYRSGRFLEALPLLEICAKTDFHCREWLAHCLQALGRNKEAESVLTVLFQDKACPENIRDNALFNLVEMVLNVYKDLNRAVSLEDSYLQSFPAGNWIEEALFGKAQALQGLGRFREAASTLEYYMEKIPAGPRKNHVLYQLGAICLHRLNDPARAFNAFDRLMKSDSCKIYAADAMFWRAQSLYYLGKSVDALAGFDEYLKQYQAGSWNKTCREMDLNIRSGK